jgi:hypothetical protein
MNRSDTIAQLSAALAQAQGEFTPAQKRGKNPQFKSGYATLDDVIASVRGPLAAHGLAVVQPLTNEGEQFILETILLHESGEWIGTETLIPHMEGNRATNTVQEFGISLTYMRRYMLTSMLGINAEEDTDGNGAGGNGKEPAKKQAVAEPKRTIEDGLTPFEVAPGVHWIDGQYRAPDGTLKPTRAKFWAWATSLTLSNEDVHTALKCEHIKDYLGSAEDAKKQIEKWVKEQAAAEGVGNG